MAGKGGGAWKVAYADFVTAMMAFFLVMWIVAQNRPVREAIAKYFKDPRGISTRDGSNSTLPNLEGSKGSVKGAQMRQPTDAIKRAIDPMEEGANANKPKLLALHDGSHLHTGTLIPFADDSAELDDGGKQRLNELVPDLLGKPNKIEVRGHASRRPMKRGSPYKNAWELAYARSLATMKYLMEKGIEPQRFRLSQAGVYEPRSVDFDADNQADNARVEVYLLGEFAEDLVGTRTERTRQVKTGGK